MYFVETGFTDGTDFIVVRYSLANFGVPSNSSILFQGNLVGIVCIDFSYTQNRPGLYAEVLMSRF
jgi:hypothetical protein